MPSARLLAAVSFVESALVAGIFLPNQAPLPTQTLSNASSERLPMDKKFVIVLRGLSFRYRNDTMGKVRLACQDYAIGSQLACSQSLVDKVIQPLEERGNQVKILITDSFEDGFVSEDYGDSSFAQGHENTSLTPPGACHLTPLIQQTFNANASYTRVAGTKYMQSAGQPWNMKNAVKFLKDTYGGVEGVQKEFDYVMVVRHDLEWVEDARDWEASFDQFNFFSRCEIPAARAVGGDDCVWDTVHLMPSSLFGVFDKTLGAEMCFAEYDVEDHNRFVGHGHGCFNPMQHALRMRRASADVEIGFLTNQRHRVRGTTGVVDLVLPKWPTHRQHLEFDSDA